jgi:hypothetical protein
MGHTAISVWRRVTKELFGSYRPELHYMRGPGPKWREKHAQRLHASNHVSSSTIGFAAVQLSAAGLGQN